MENNNKNPKIEKGVAIATNNDIYNEDNLFTGAVEQEEIKPQFEDWFKVKIQGIVKSYKIHDNGSIQLKFQEVVEKDIGGVVFNDYEDKSIRITATKPFSNKQGQELVGKSIEVLNVSETAQYKKISEGQYDFNKIERYFYSADNLKVIDKDIENGYQLFKIFELTVKDIAPALKYDQRKRKQVIDKDKSILVYEISNDTLSTLHKITVDGLTFANAQTLKGKDVVVLDLQQFGKNYYCSKIKVK
ncbi:hypothetical protein HOK00_03895 [bacterium]|nr:hypothetical protein [bacterium]